MKLPRGVPADRLITVPLHSSLKNGTLHGILSEVAKMRSITMGFLIELL
jgi:hypothetical protein